MSSSHLRLNAFRKQGSLHHHSLLMLVCIHTAPELEHKILLRQCVHQEYKRGNKYEYQRVFPEPREDHG